MCSASPPPAPDYAAAAQATAAGNLQSAQQAVIANRPNQYTPYGSSTWTNTPTFDQAGYDAAMAKYNAAQGQQGGGGHYETQTIMDSPNEGASTPQSVQVWVPGSGGGSSVPMPNRADFTGGDNWQNTITFSPQMQALFDQQQKLQTGLFGAQDQALGRVNQTMGQGFDMSGIPQAGTALNPNSLPGFGSVYDPTKSTNTATDAIMARVNPQLDRQEAALRTQLANQGISQGSQAWNTAMDELNRQKNDAFTQAGLQGINLGMQQQGQTFGQSTTNQQLAATLQNQQFGQQQGLRSQGMSEQAYLRSLPMNELNALRTGNQVSQPTFPGFSQQATTAGPDMLGAANAQYNAALGASNAQNAQSAGTMGGLFGLGQLGMMGAGMGLFGAGGDGLGLAGIATMPASFSDRRLKTNIRRVGTANNDLPIYSYRYKWGGPTQLGFMADEVKKVAPEAVGERAGYLTVDYSKVH